MRPIVGHNTWTANNGDRGSVTGFYDAKMQPVSDLDLAVWIKCRSDRDQSEFLIELERTNLSVSVIDDKDSPPRVELPEGRLN